MIKMECNFHGYKILRCGTILSKSGQPLKYELRARLGGKFDQCVRLFINGKAKKFTVSRLICEAFDGPCFGYEVNHKDRDTMNNHIDNLERTTPKENQKHWREDNKKRKEQNGLATA